MIKPLTSSYSTRWINTVAQVPQTAWDALAQPLITPFFEWDWLHNIESSGSATGRTGWLPHHLTVWRDQQLVGIAPLYVKGHSRGEFVFDNQWADVAHQLGIEYYPKLLGMSPFTPAEGYRFMIAPGEDEEEITGLMVHSIDQFCIENKISGCNFLYVDPEWKPMLEKFGFASWLHHSYIWKNQEYETFDDYLKGFNANQRRNIKRERKAVTQAGLNLQTYTGDQIPKAFFSEMYEFYASTCDKFGWWGSKYLTRRFFEQLHHNYRHRVLFVAAFDDTTQHQPMGMSFCLTKGDRLYGRYWGSVQDIDCLHFDA
ncbi:MAG TPA: GNAT family N-acetyltransferase, partial [Planktothrix sp. UBA8407]|nr:GNAT family N-acetyltransferase [Planktothrix sp. UBA8407]